MGGRRPDGGSTESMLTGYAGQASILLAVRWFITQLGRELIPPLLPTIIDRLEITPFLAGLALTFLWAVYALIQYPGGRLSDRLSRKTVLAVGLVLLISGFTTLMTTTTYVVLFVGFALVGVGAGMYFISMRALLSDLFTDRRGESFRPQPGGREGGERRRHRLRHRRPCGYGMAGRNRPRSRGTRSRTDRTPPANPRTVRVQVRVA